MLRRKFLTSATTTLLGTLPLARAVAKPAKRLPKKGFVVKNGVSRFGKPTPFRGINPNDLKVSGADTGGALAVFEYTGNEQVGPSLHMHLEQDELFYVVEGEYLFQVGDERVIAKKGDTVFGPRNVPHTWIQVSPVGKLVYAVQPAGKLEDFFAIMSTMKGIPSHEDLLRIHQEHGMVVLGPPMTLPK